MQPQGDHSARHQGNRYAWVAMRYALLLWVVGCLLPAGEVNGRFVYGWELALHAFNPMLIFFEPFAFLAAWTNLVFLAQAGRIARQRQANTAALAVSFLINLLALAQAASARQPIIAWTGFTVLTPLPWLAAFLALLSAALSQDAQDARETVPPAARTHSSPPDD